MKVGRQDEAISYRFVCSRHISDMPPRLWKLGFL